MTIDGVIEATGAGRRDLDNWVARLSHTSDFAPTIRGKARQFTKLNVRELAFIAAFVRAGLSPSRASEICKLFVFNKAPLLPEWFIFPAGDDSQFFPSDKPDMEEVLKRFGTEIRPTVFTFVALGETSRRVDALFQDAPDD